MVGPVPESVEVDELLSPNPVMLAMATNNAAIATPNEPHINTERSSLFMRLPCSLLRQGSQGYQLGPLGT